jgi:outer membrane receptor protein involved in Fe transport
MYTTLNFGDARSEGFDIALAASPFDGLEIGVSVSYTDARSTTDIPGADGTLIQRKGEPLNVAPWAAYVNGEYEFPVGTNRAYARADFAYTSHDDTPLDLDSPLVDPGIPRPAATRNLDLRAGMRIRGLDVSVFVSNALNDHPELARFHDVPGTGGFRAITTRPRTIGLTASIRM